MTTIHPRSSALPVSNPTDLVWLNALPQHWEARKLKYCLAVNESTLPETTDPDFKFRYIEIGAVNSEGLVERPAIIQFSAAPSRARRVIKGGDTIVSTVRTYLKAVWHAEEPEKDLICSTGFAVLTPKRGTVPKFASYVARSAPFTDQMTAESVGIAYPAITESKLGDLRICLPPCEEQAAIVRYLDEADQQIQAYISAKKKLIALLAEQRQAVIHQAVTRGLDPNVRLKPSGVEWLGEVPEHWEIRRVRTLGQAIIGLTYSPQDTVDKDEGILVLRASNIFGGRIVDADNVYVRCPVPEKLFLREGDILICSRSGSRNLIGKNARIEATVSNIFGGRIVDADNVYVRCPVPEKLFLREGDILICSRSGSRNLIGKNARIEATVSGATFGAFMTILRGRNNDYLHQVFNSKLFEYQSGAFLTSTINQLTLGILNDMKIPFPPTAEQSNILVVSQT